MSGTNHLMTAEDKVFRFISDPGHKENLSGRVRAACLTCRKKKIRCSGEANCRTCQERGTGCEGFPERKKPSKERRSSVILDAVAAGIKCRKRSGSPKKPLRRRSETLYRGDSGYSSDRAGTLDNGASLASSAPTASSSGVRKSLDGSDYRSSALHRSPPPHLSIDTWHIDAQHAVDTAGDLQHTASIASQLGLASQDLPMPASTLAQYSPDWAGTSTGNDWWLDSTWNGEEGLVSGPESWLDQAPTRQPFVNQRPHGGLHDPTARRQTIAFPLPNPIAAGARGDMLHLRTLSTGGPFSAPELKGMTEYNYPDNMALSPTDRIDFTPSLTDFSSWWEINGVGDVATIFGLSDSTSVPTPCDTQPRPCPSLWTSEMVPVSQAEFAHSAS